MIKEHGGEGEEEEEGMGEEGEKGTLHCKGIGICPNYLRE